jgi:hypothetical protein
VIVRPNDALQSLVLNIPEDAETAASEEGMMAEPTLACSNIWRSPAAASDPLVQS